MVHLCIEKRNCSNGINSLTPRSSVILEMTCSQHTYYSTTVILYGLQWLKWNVVLPKTIKVFLMQKHFILFLLYNLNKIKIQFLSFIVTFQALNSRKWLVAAEWDGTRVGHFHYCRKLYWTVLVWSAGGHILLHGTGQAYACDRILVTHLESHRLNGACQIRGPGKWEK